MLHFDVSKFREELLSAGEQWREHAKHTRKAELHNRLKRLRRNQELEDLLKPALITAGVDVERLDEVLALNQAEARSSFRESKADFSRCSSSERDALHQRILQGNKALEYLAANEAFGGLSSILTLAEPFLIWEWPHGDASLVRTHMEALKSFAKINLDIPVYAFDDDWGSGQREYSFYFMWENQSDYLAVVKSYSVLGLNGACELYANSGIFSGHGTSLSIDAYLYPISYWLPLPPGGSIRTLRMQGDSLQHQSVLYNLTARGGHIFGDACSASHIFSADSYGMSYGSYGGISIPARSTALFEVNLTINYSWEGNSLPDEIIADFADDNLNYAVECPLVALEFLTPPPVMG